MDIMEKINDLRAQKGELLGQAEALVAEGKFEEADQITAKMEGINHRIAGLEKLAKASQGAAQPAYDGALHGSGRNPRRGPGRTPWGKRFSTPLPRSGRRRWCRG